LFEYFRSSIFKRRKGKNSTRKKKLCFEIFLKTCVRAISQWSIIADSGVSSPDFPFSSTLLLVMQASSFLCALRYSAWHFAKPRFVKPNSLVGRFSFLSRFTNDSKRRIALKYNDLY